MNVRLIGGPANGELVVIPDDRRELGVPELMSGRPYYGEDTPIPVKYYHYRPHKLVDNPSPEQIIPFYLDGEMPNG